MKRMLCVIGMAAALLGAGGCGGPWDRTARESAGPAAVPGAKYVALTFDDGPRADTTGRLLDGLAERGAKATFFVIGEQIPGNEALLERMAVEGHQIGNHTYTHVKLSEADRVTAVEEIRKTEVLVSEIVGESDVWLRPPYGRIGPEQAALVRTPMIYWSVDPRDWQLLDADKVTETVLGSAGDGDIVLLHDFYPTSVDAALRVVDALQGEGYRFVTVRELFRLRGVAPAAGTLYARPEETRPLS